ncbi:MAG: hypothetical protein CME65_10770 [Halobacteriovoraceae bacterium]|nr:hypothetical protein [Halobacteriovoraceae bacterium]|tara:strand:+ start:7173 stop:7847 length:675 start_codon:yes stop_codon:yes gene_type:complete
METELKLSNTKGRFLIEDHRNLLKLFAAKSPLHTLLFLIPLAIFPVLYLNDQDVFISEIVILFPIGVFYWSFVEYFIHRWVFHFKAKNKIINYIVGSFHTYHHQNPKDLDVLTSGWITALAGLGFHGSIFYLFTGFSFKYASILILSTIFAYFIYEIVHYQVHMKVYKTGVLKYLQDFHLTHHVNPTGNYGQTSGLWDVIFRTRIPSKETSKNKSMQNFVKECQ